MKRVFCFIAALLLLALSVCADYVPENVYDYAGLLTAGQCAELDRRAAELTAKYGCQVVVFTVEDTEGYFIEDYAEAVYDAFELGVGPEGSCVMLLLSMKERDYDIFAHGSGNRIFTDYGKEKLSGTFLRQLGANDWYDGLGSFIEGTVAFFDSSAAGRPIDTNYDPVRSAFTGRDALVTVGICFIPALIVVLIMRAGMKTVREQKAAANYAVNESFRLRRSDDRFLRRSVQRVRREQSSRSSGGGGTHVSSHGSSHHSGKF